MFSSASDNWATPRALYDQYDDIYHFTLDGAADRTNHQCDEWLGPGGLSEDALSVEWTGHSVWLNPPYSRVREFLQHAIDQSLTHDVGTVLLLPSRTDTKWFHDCVWYAPYQAPYPWVKSVQFLKGRVKFNRADDHAYVSAGIGECNLCGGSRKEHLANSAPFPSLVVVLNGDWS